MTLRVSLGHQPHRGPVSPIPTGPRHGHRRPVFWAPRRVQLEPGQVPHLDQTVRHSLTRRSPSPAPRHGPSEARPPLTRVIKRPAGTPPVFASNGATAQSARYPLISRSQSSRHGHRRPVFWAPRRVQLEPGRDPHLAQTPRHSQTGRLLTPAPTCLQVRVPARPPRPAAGCGHRRPPLTHIIRHLSEPRRP